jgi:hypothetical protein
MLRSMVDQILLIFSVLTPYSLGVSQRSGADLVVIYGDGAVLV